MTSFDESINTIFQNEQIDKLKRFWNNSEGIAETRYFDSMFLNQPNGQNLFDCLKLSTKQLKEENLVQISMDDLTINWNVVNLNTESQSEKELDPLFVIGSCSQHVVHGTFQNGVT